jgi:hypothetical protein
VQLDNILHGTAADGKVDLAKFAKFWIVGE